MDDGVGEDDVEGMADCNNEEDGCGCCNCLESDSAEHGLSFPDITDAMQAEDT